MAGVCGSLGRQAAKRRATWCVVAIAAVVAAGCGKSGPKLHPASGTVTLDGKPLADATVTFVPSAGRPSDGKTDASGKYAIMTNGQPGVPEGDYKVAVSKFTAQGEMPVMAPSPQDMVKMYEKKKKGEIEKSPVPAKYGRADTSGLSAKVGSDASKNVFDLPLDTK